MLSFGRGDTRMPDLAHVHGKKLAIILVDDDGTQAGEWVVITGTADWRDGHLFVHRGMDVQEFPIPDETLDRIKPVVPSVRGILEQADYSVMLRVGPIPEGVDPSSLIKTGFKWPGKRE